MSTSSSRYDYSFDPTDDSTASRVCRLVGSGRQVLELGCAAGAMSAVMTHHYGCRVTGVEYDPAAAAEARRHCVAVHELSLDDAGWVSGVSGTALSGAAFDTVVAADVLEHLRNPQACLRAVRELLPADGQLVVSTPSVAHSGVLAALLLNRFDYRDTGLLDRTHIHFFTVATLGEALVDAGFEVTDVQTVDTGHWHPEFAELWQQLPPAVHEWLQGNPAGKAFQVVMRAVPSVERKEFVDPFAEKQREWLGQMKQVSDTLVSDTQVTGGAELRVEEKKVSDTGALAGEKQGSDTAVPAVSDPVVRWWRRWFS